MPLATADEVWVIIAAAGSGTRLGGRAKQFRLLGGVPVLVRTARVFDHHPRVSGIAVACPARLEEETSGLLTEHGITKLVGVAAGGASRQESIGNALELLDDRQGVVLTHDAVRPFVSSSEIEAVVDSARLHGAAAPVVPISDTVYRTDADVLDQTVDREGLVRIQTPQGFQIDLLREAHAEARKRGIAATDETGLVKACGHVVWTVAGSSRNLKITTLEDWALAQLYCKQETATAGN
jgi:2-C-methyl-D-erythritol 4-phosphate cytidylyltransferase